MGQQLNSSTTFIPEKRFATQHKIYPSCAILLFGPVNGDEVIQETQKEKSQLQRQILDFCRHVAGSARVVGISLFDNCPAEGSSAKTAIQVVAVIRDFQPKLMSYVKVLNGRNLIIVAVDRWVFERDIERGFLGEAAVGMLVFPYVAVEGKHSLHAQEVFLKKHANCGF